MLTSESNRLWEDITRATDKVGGPLALSLRFPLFIALQPGDHLTPGRQLREMAASFRDFIRSVKKVLPPVPKGKPLFCFAHATPSNMKNLLPVAREARRRGLLGGIVTAENYSNELREFSGISPIVSASDLTPPLTTSERVALLSEMVSIYTRVRRAMLEYRPEFGYLMLRTIGSLTRHLACAARFGEPLGRLLDSWQPSCVVCTSDFWPFESQLCYQASCRSIPFVVSQHGTIGHHWWPFVADVYCMWGDAFVEQMQSLGASRDRLASIGMPASDDLFNKIGSIDKVAPRLERPVCLILSHTHGRYLEPEIFDAFRKVLPEVINKTPEITWKVKLHPVEDRSFYQQMGADVYNRLTFYSQGASLEGAVRECDIATTLYSTAGLEAMMLDRPLAVACPSSRVEELAWWPAQGGGVYVRTAQEYITTLTRLALDSKHRDAQLTAQRTFLARAFANQGHAAESLVSFIEKYFTGPREAGCPGSDLHAAGEANSGDATLLPILR